MRGVVLAGGTGSRLLPLTQSTNKHLLTVHDRPMIHFPVGALVGAGILVLYAAGVHAYGQAASVTSAAPQPVDVLRRGMNATLPADVRVLDVREMPRGFHARYHAKRKLYRYRIDTAAVQLPFERRYAWHLPYACDLDAMRDAAARFVGRHDFAALQGGGSSVLGTVRTLTRVAVDAPGLVRAADGKPAPVLSIDAPDDGRDELRGKVVAASLAVDDHPVGHVRTEELLLDHVQGQRPRLALLMEELLADRRLDATLSRSA